MARLETIFQTDFSLGAVRPEAVERDDTQLIEKSVKVAVNTVVLSTGQIEGRPGMLHIGSSQAKRGREVDLGAGRVYDLHIVADGVILYDRDGAIAYQNLSRPWLGLTPLWGAPVFDAIPFWVIADPDTSSILIGSKHTPIQALTVDPAGTWAFGTFLFAKSLANAISQPYWNYHPGNTITPSARTGNITVICTSPIWTAGHVGMSVRYVDREIRLTSRVSPTVMNATVIEELPPTYTFQMVSVSGYQVGDAVEHSVLGGKGIVISIVGLFIKVLSVSVFTGFDGTGKLIGPNAAQSISSFVEDVPAPTFLWDMQLMSGASGYAGWGMKHRGRAYLCAFPGAPQAFAASVVGDVSDFTMGADDADGFVDTVGSDRGGELLYMVSAEDLLFLTSKGLFYQQTRDGSAITPSTIGPVSFSSKGCAKIEPVAIDDGCIFVDAVGSQIHAAMLAGDVYRSWKAVPMGKYHEHLTGEPVFLGATTYGSETSEQFIYAVKSDGTAAVCQWDRDEQLISWRPWVTDGSFLSIYQCFGRVLAVVDRTIASVPARFREAFHRDIVSDCATVLAVSPSFPAGQVGVVGDGWLTRFPKHLSSHVAAVYMEGWDLEDRLIDASGKPSDTDGQVLAFPAITGNVQMGLPFSVEIIPWARRSVRTQRGIRSVKRLVKMFVTVQETGQFSVDGHPLGAYRTGEDLTVPPPMRDVQYGVVFVGRENYEARPIIRDRPGKFRLLKIGYRVTI